MDDCPAAAAVVFALLVGVVGMPHGGLDHLFGRAVFFPLVGGWWRAAFAVTYLGVAALVVTGWLVAPAVTVVAFFLISAFHFGDADGSTGLAAVAEGGLVVWVPVLARPVEVAEILSWVVPDADPVAVHSAVVAAGLACGLALIAVAGRAVWRVTCGESWVAVRLVTFTVLFALAPVLVGFVVYFCGWHSTRELATLARRANPARPGRGLLTVVRLAAPRAGLAVAATALAAWYFSTGRPLTPVVVQAVFLGLSAVAIPHILLHAAATRLGAEPFDRPLAGALA